MQLAARLLHSHRNWQIEELFSLMFTFQRDGSQVLDKDSPSLKRLTKCLSSLQKDVYAFQRKEKVLIITTLLR